MGPDARSDFESSLLASCHLRSPHKLLLSNRLLGLCRTSKAQMKGIIFRLGWMSRMTIFSWSGMALQAPYNPVSSVRERLWPRLDLLWHLSESCAMGGDVFSTQLAQFVDLHGGPHSQSAHCWVVPNGISPSPETATIAKVIGSLIQRLLVPVVLLARSEICEPALAFELSLPAMRSIEFYICQVALSSTQRMSTPSHPQALMWEIQRRGPAP